MFLPLSVSAHGNVRMLSLDKWLGDLGEFLRVVRRLEVEDSKNN